MHAACQRTARPPPGGPPARPLCPPLSAGAGRDSGTTESEGWGGEAGGHLQCGECRWAAGTHKHMGQRAPCLDRGRLAGRLPWPPKREAANCGAGAAAEPACGHSVHKSPPCRSGGAPAARPCMSRPGRPPRAPCFPQGVLPSELEDAARSLSTNSFTPPLPSAPHPTPHPSPTLLFIRR